MIFKRDCENYLDAYFVPKYNWHSSGKREEIPVTVCVAAMFDEHGILGASDRMLTAGDVQFEPQQPKIIFISNSIAAMIAGDSSMQAEIMQKVKADVRKRIDEDSSTWVNIKDVAELYMVYYNESRLKRAEQSILAPFGLDSNSFISRQKEMEAGFVRQIATELLNYEAPRISAIFAGVDTSGAHLYVADNDSINCRDNVGFAAIGVGYWHANSQIMFAGHTRRKSFPETLLLVYSAKKRAEVAPGVGGATDMFAVGPRLGSYIEIGDHVITNLQKIYEDEQRREWRAANKAKESVNKYVEEINRTAAAKEQKTGEGDSGGDTPVDQKEFRDNTQGDQPEK